MASSFPSPSLSLCGCEMSGWEQMVSVELVSPPGYCGWQPPLLTILELSLGAKASPPAVPSWQLSSSPPSQPKSMATRPPSPRLCVHNGLSISSKTNKQSPTGRP